MSYKKMLSLVFLICLASFPVYARQESDDVSWLSILESQQNAVVKIISISRAFNWFNPYIINSPYHMCGSGFFINENDEIFIVTNAHVVDHAIAVFISIPSFGKKRFRAEIVSIFPQYDLALLRLTNDSMKSIKNRMDSISFLELGDSDLVNRFDEVLTLGFPLDSETIKSTSGIISGRSPIKINNYSMYCFQIDAPINPGNSGGPLFNEEGKVVGINSATMMNAQNYNFAIPINILKQQLPYLMDHKLLKIGNIGLVWFYATDEVREYLGNPLDQGCFVCDVCHNSNADRAGIQAEDMIYAIDGYPIDSYGQIVLPATSDKIDFTHYIGQLQLGSTISLLLYRKGEPYTVEITLDSDSFCSIPYVFPGYEEVDYEIFGGMIVMELTVNYILEAYKDRPTLQRYLTNLCQNGKRLIVSNLLPDSKLAQMRTINWGDTINEVNGEVVTTLEEFRAALLKSKETGFVVIRTTDEITLNTENVLTVLSLKESCREEKKLAKMHEYKISDTVAELLDLFC